MSRSATLAKAVTVFALFLLDVSIATAQDRGHLKGSISDSGGGAIDRIQIFVETPAAKFEATTNDNGLYDLELPEGLYRVTTSKKLGFLAFKRDRIRVRTGRTTILNIKLKVTLDDAICVLYITASPTKKSEKANKGTKD